MAQQVEHVLGKDEVTGSNPVISSKKRQPTGVVFFSRWALATLGNSSPKRLRIGCNSEFLVKSAFVGVDSHLWMKWLHDKIRLDGV